MALYRVCRLDGSFALVALPPGRKPEFGWDPLDPEAVEQFARLGVRRRVVPRFWHKRKATHA